MYQEDASGWQIFSYGKLGEVTENIRTFALPFESKPYTFRMNFEYDSWNRIQKMTYPDGEVVNYRYNLGGMLDNPTLYASPYIVCTPKGYTKHYYAENERVTSKIGNGCLQDLCKSINVYADFNEKDEMDNFYLYDCEEENDTLKNKMECNYLYWKEIMECVSAGSFIVESKLSSIYERMGCLNEVEKECYWYHPDHLGSSSWITEAGGKPIQHLHYLPWGEDFVDQRTSNWNALYAFASKERDTETGLSYFGARYYSSDLSIWLSVDPMSGEYPHQSNYVYCSNNPIMVVDPNGEDEYEFDECGKLVNRIANNDFDQFHVVDANGQRLASSVTFESNTFILLNGEDGKTMFQSSGKNASSMTEEAFVFFADNTKVEWEYAETNQGVYIGTSQTESSSRIGGLLINEGHIINRHVHNHHGGNTTPSESDHNFAYNVFGRNSNAKLEIFTSYKQTTVDVWRPYDECTPYIEKKTKQMVFP